MFSLFPAVGQQFLICLLGKKIIIVDFSSHASRSILIVRRVVEEVNDIVIVVKMAFIYLNNMFKIYLMLMINRN